MKYALNVIVVVLWAYPAMALGYLFWMAKEGFLTGAFFAELHDKETQDWLERRKK